MQDTWTADWFPPQSLLKFVGEPSGTLDASAVVTWYKGKVQLCYFKGRAGTSAATWSRIMPRELEDIGDPPETGPNLDGISSMLDILCKTRWVGVATDSVRLPMHLHGCVPHARLNIIFVVDCLTVLPVFSVLVLIFHVSYCVVSSPATLFH